MSTFQAAIKTSVSKSVADELTYKILAIIHREYAAGNTAVQAIVQEAMSR